MSLDVDQLLRHERLLALPPAVRDKLRTVLPHFLENGSVQGRHYGAGQHFGWRIRYRVTTPEGRQRQGSLSLGATGPALLAAQLLTELKREELAQESQLRADEQACRAEDRARARQLKHLRGLFMRQAPGSLKFKRLAWEQVNKNIPAAQISLEGLEAYVKACAGQVRPPARGRPRQRRFGARPLATRKPGLLAQAAGLLWAAQQPPKQAPGSKPGS